MPSNFWMFWKNIEPTAKLSIKHEGEKEEEEKEEKINNDIWSMQASRGSYHSLHMEKSSKKYISKARKNIAQGDDVR